MEWGQGGETCCTIPIAHSEEVCSELGRRQEGQVHGRRRCIAQGRAQSARKSSPSLLAITHGEGIWRQGSR